MGRSNSFDEGHRLRSSRLPGKFAAIKQQMFGTVSANRSLIRAEGHLTAEITNRARVYKMSDDLSL